MALGHGQYRTLQEVEQFVIAKGSNRQISRQMTIAAQRHIHHPLQQGKGGGKQRLRHWVSLQPLIEQLRGGFPLVAVGVEEADLARIVFPGGAETLLAQKADRQLRQRPQIEYVLRREGTQLRRQHLGIVLIRTDHAGEVLSI